MNPYLQNSYNMYGPDSFIYHALENCPKEQLTEREAYYTNLLDPEMIYNLRAIKDSIEMAESTRLKLVVAQTGKKASLEARMNMSLAAKGRKFSDEHKRKLSEANKNRKVSDETKEKIRNSLIGMKHTQSSTDKKKAFAKTFCTKEHMDLMRQRRTPSVALSNSDKIIERRNSGATLKAIAEEFGISTSAVCRVVKGWNK